MPPDDIRMKVPFALTVSSDIYAAMGSPETIPVRLGPSLEPGSVIPVTEHGWGIITPAHAQVSARLWLIHALHRALNRSNSFTTERLLALTEKVEELK